MEILFHNCTLCNYKTKRKYDLKRHENAKHNKIKTQNNNTIIDNKNTTVDNKNLNLDNKNLNLDNKNLNFDNKCNKCNKIFSSKQYLNKHILICKGVSNALECHLCHKIFANSGSKSKHLKICKEKSQQLVLIPEQSIQQLEQLEQLDVIPETINNNTQIILNNNCNNNNITYNINLIHFNEDEFKIEFDISHLEKNIIVYKLYVIEPEDAFRVFYKKLFDNKNNQMIIKENLKHTFSKVHTGQNIWKKILDDNIYHIIMHFISETILSYIYNHTKNKEDIKYKQLRNYLECMATKGYSYNNTKENEKSYKNHIKSLKLLFNSFL